MALEKSTPLASFPEVSANYHRIEQVSYVRREHIIEIVVGVYPSELHAQNGLAPVETRVFRLVGAEAEIPLAALHDAAGSLLYDFLRSEEFYSDATNA